MEFKKMTIEEFIKELASNSPAPGGGTAAALGGAMGISLFEMVANLTIGKKGFESVRDQMQSRVEEFSEKRGKLLELMDTDTEVFNEFMAALKLPKNTEEEKTIRRQKMQETLKKAAQVPLTVAKEILSTLKEGRFMAENGNPNAISDVGVGALFAEAAIRSAIYNVFINLSSIKDEEFVKTYKEEAEKILSEAAEVSKSILKEVEEKL